MDAILRAFNLHKTYRSPGGEVRALRGVNLALEPGELVAVMGPSGCGKSTLLHVLGGLDTPSDGEVYIAGQRTDNASEGRRAVLRRRLIGFVFQTFNLIGNLTVADNVEIPALVAGVSAREARSRREQLLSDLGIADKARSVPAQLSGGERQRVAVARALINSPAVVLADEPTGNLDSATAREVMSVFKRHNQLGQTILLVTHDAGVASIAGRVLQMRDGTLDG